MREFRVPLPSSLRLRQMKDLTSRELLYAVNCLPASSSGGLYLWRPQADLSTETVLSGEYGYLAHCRFRDGIALVVKDVSLGQTPQDWRIGLALFRASSSGVELKSYSTLGSLIPSNREISAVQISNSMIGIASAVHGLIICEIDEDNWSLINWYIAGGLITSKYKVGSVGVSANAGSTADYIVYLGYDPSYVYVDSGAEIPVFVSSVTFYCGSVGQSNDFILWAELYDRNGNLVASSSERFSSVVQLSDYNKVIDFGQAVTFTFMEKLNVGNFSDQNRAYIRLVLQNNDANNSASIALAVSYESLATHLSWFRASDNPLFYTGRIGTLSINGIPVCSVIDKVNKKSVASGKIASSGPYIICPSQSYSIAIGDPVTLQFHTEVPLKGQITDMKAFGSEAIVSTTAETYSVSLSFTEPKPRVILPSSCRSLYQTSSGVFALFKDRLFRILQGSVIEVAVPIGIAEASRLVYIDDYGILLVIQDNAEDMLAYSEYSGSWLYWRLDELKRSARILEYNDGLILTESGTFDEQDLRFYRFSHSQLESSYEVALYLITEPFPDLTKFQLQALEIDGNLLISDESNANISVASLSDNQSAYLVQSLGTPWHTTPPLHSFSAGGASGQFLGVVPFSTEPLRGQPIVFQGTQGTDITQGSQYEPGTFLTGRRFILGLYISDQERKEPNNYILGFRLYGRPAGQGIIGG